MKFSCDIEIIASQLSERGRGHIVTKFAETGPNFVFLVIVNCFLADVPVIV